MIGERGDNWQSKVPMGWDQGHSFEPLGSEALGMGGAGRNGSAIGLLVGRKQAFPLGDLGVIHQVGSEVICLELGAGLGRGLSRMVKIENCC